MTAPPTRSYLTSVQLKWLAMTTMFIDHLAAALVQPVSLQTGLGSLSLGQSDQLVFLMRLIGRLAFPIFCFLLVEGFRYTRNRWAYARRLGLFALVSEIPFDLALHQQIFYWGGQNVYFTLFLAFLAMGLMTYFKDRSYLAGGSVVLLALLAELLATDYGAYGVVFVVLLHYYDQNRLRQLAMVALMGLAQLTASLAVIPLACYNGRKGRGNSKVFYLFYPVHLLVLAIIRYHLLGY